MKRSVLSALSAALFLNGCGGEKPGSTKPAAPEVKASAWTNFSGDRAMEDVKAIVNIGPRPSGSPEIETTRQYIEKRLKEAGWETKRQEFTADTVLRGAIPMANVRARFPVAGQDPWSRPVRTLVCSHYDTKWFQSTRFVGANDGGSSTGLLIEVARAAAPVKEFAASLELIFFDGEEAVTGFTTPGGFNDNRYDGLYGSRYYAKELRSGPAAERPKYCVVFDMIADQRLEVELPRNGSRRLNALALEAAAELNFSIHFREGPDIIDDHVPLSWLGLEVINFIDFTSFQEYWHTSADTLDKLNPESLQISGRTGLLFIEKQLSQ